VTRSAPGWPFWTLFDGDDSDEESDKEGEDERVKKEKPWTIQGATLEVTQKTNDSIKIFELNIQLLARLVSCRHHSPTGPHIFPESLSVTWSL
jgi:hypothetical protein